MLFSIVIPVYNVQDYLEECVQSILLQVNMIDNDCEILLIDDGSKDESGRICDKYKEQYPDIIKVFHKENEGLLATRRYGFKRASGEYIVNCDSDDMLEDGMLKSVKKMIDKYNKPDIILINYYRYDGNIKNVGYENIFTNGHDSMVPKNKVLHEYMSGHSIVSMCGKIIKRTCIDFEMNYEKYGRLSTGEDSLQTIEFFSNANKFVYLNEALYDYRSGSGMTEKFDSNYYFTFKKIFKEINKKNNDWNLKDFDKLFSIKVLQTAGRAITQSRYNKWNSMKEQKEYLKRIRNDNMLIESFSYINAVKSNLQVDHYLLLELLKRRLYKIIILLLNIKNAF